MATATNIVSRAPLWLLILGWIFAVLGGFIGLLIGVHIRSAKITDLDGHKANRYDDGSRKQGLIIVILSIVMLVVWMAVNIASR